MKIKEVRDREEDILTKKKRLQAAQAQLEKVVKAQKPSDQARFEVENADAELKKLVADHEGLKRADIKSALKIQFQSMKDLAKKVKSDKSRSSSDKILNLFAVS
jgi:hypothetical protein